MGDEDVLVTNRRDRVAEVIREALHDREHDALPPTPGEIADRLMPWMQPAGNVREWTRMARQVDAIRRLADELEAESYADRLSGEDFDRGAAWGREDTADRIRALLGAES